MITAIVGLSKNAGKTSVLNHLLDNNSSSKIAVFSTGRDGEDVDLVAGNKKPKVELPPNCYYTTFDYEIKKNAHLLQILRKLPLKSNGRSLWLVKTLADLQAEIIGPQSRKSQEILLQILAEYQVEEIYIDGALDRKSIILSDKIDKTIIVAGATFGTIENIHNELERLILLSGISPTEKENLDETITFGLERETIITDEKTLFSQSDKIEEIMQSSKDWLYLPGAITNKIFDKYSNRLKGLQLIVNHPLNIHLSLVNLKSLLKISDVKSAKNFEIAEIYLNSFSVNNKHLDAENLRSKIRNSFEMPIKDIMEVGWENG